MELQEVSPSYSLTARADHIQLLAKLYAWTNLKNKQVQKNEIYSKPQICSIIQ